MSQKIKKKSLFSSLYFFNNYYSSVILSNKKGKKPVFFKMKKLFFHSHGLAIHENNKNKNSYKFYDLHFNLLTNNNIKKSFFSKMINTIKKWFFYISKLFFFNKKNINVYLDFVDIIILDDSFHNISECESLSSNELFILNREIIYKNMYTHCKYDEFMSCIQHDKNPDLYFIYHLWDKSFLFEWEEYNYIISTNFYKVVTKEDGRVFYMHTIFYIDDESGCDTDYEVWMSETIQTGLVIRAILSFSEKISDHEASSIIHLFKDYINSSMPYYVYDGIINSIEKLNNTDIESFIRKTNSFTTKKNISKPIELTKRFYSSKFILKDTKRFYNFFKLLINKKLVVSSYTYICHVNETLLINLQKEGVINSSKYHSLIKTKNHHLIIIKDEETNQLFRIGTTSSKGSTLKKNKLDNECVQTLINFGCKTVLKVDKPSYNTKHILWGDFTNLNEYHDKGITFSLSKGVKIDQESFLNQWEVGKKYFKETDFSGTEVREFTYVNVNKESFSFSENKSDFAHTLIENSEVGDNISYDNKINIEDNDFYGNNKNDF